MENREQYEGTRIRQATGAREARQVSFHFIPHAILQRYFNLLSEKVIDTIKAST